MALTTAQAMSAFLTDSVNPTEAQRLEIAVRRKKTAEYLAAAFPSTSDMPVSTVTLIGSADRGTLARPLDDVDVMAKFSNGNQAFETYRSDSFAFINRIRTALDAKTSIKKIGVRGQAVRLFYTSGAHVDIAPVFKWSGSGYALPSGDGGWITTDPPKQAEWFASKKETVGASLPAIVRLAKRWNDVHSKRFESYHLEVVASTTFSSVGSNYRDAMKAFFEWAPQHIDVYDPAGHSGLLSSYLTSSARIAINSRLREAKDRAINALKAEALGDHAEAKRLWRVELGDQFPTR